MKKIFKFFPVALAALALASCSSDDFESLGTQVQDVTSKGDLRMDWDPFDDEVTTRTLRDDNFGTLRFQNGDQVNVYDETAYAYDCYKFTDDAFYYASTGDKLVTAPVFGIMPGANIDKAYLNREAMQTQVDIEIPRVIKYNAESETTLDGKAMYACNLPAFGYAKLEEGVDYLKVSNLRYMVAILKINLKNAFANASYLKLSNAAGKPLSGMLTAPLKSLENKKDVYLQVLDKKLPVYPDLYIDLREVPSETSCIYIPVVPGLDATTDGIKLEYSDDRTTDDPRTIGKWTATGMKFPNKVFKAHSRYEGEHEFKLTDMNPKKVSDILAQYHASAENITLDLTKEFTIDASDDDVTNVIKLPEFDKKDMVVTINLVAPFTAFTNKGNKPLIVKNVDDANPTNAKVILNLGTITPDADKLNLEIDAPGADLQVVGDFSGQTTLTLVNAEKFTFGDGTHDTDFSKLKTVDWGQKDAGVKEIVIAKGATVTVNDAANMILGSSSTTNTITEKLTVNGTLNVNGHLQLHGKAFKELIVGDGAVLNTATNKISALYNSVLEKIDIEGAVTTAEINCPTAAPVAISVKGNGTVDGNIAVNNVASTISVAGKGKVKGNINAAKVINGNLSITSETDKAVEGDVTIAGDVTVAMAAEGEAITGTLTMKGSAKTLNLKQGYINKIAAAVDDNGEWETPTLNIKLDNTDEGRAAFMELDITEGVVVDYTSSIWDGNVITNATYKGVQTTIKYGSTTLTSQAVFTASQLASLGTVTAVNLYNDIDLAGAGKGQNKWVGFNTQGLYCYEIKNGAKAEKVREIKNLNLQHSSAKGLINTLSGTYGVKNLTITGVTGAKGIKADGVGALAGENTGTGTIQNVTVTGIAIQKGSGDHTEYGGIIGKNTGAVTLKNVSAAGTIDGKENIGGLVGSTATGKLTLDGCTATVNINGGYKLGGLVGSTKGALDIKSCTATTTITSVVYATEKMYIDYAKIGGFIGAADDKDNAVITIDALTGSHGRFNTTAVNSKMFISDTSAGVGNFYDYTRVEDFIGYCGVGSSTTHVPTYKSITVGTTAPYSSYTAGGLVNAKPASTSLLISYMLKQQ